DRAADVEVGAGVDGAVGRDRDRAVGRGRDHRIPVNGDDAAAAGIDDASRIRHNRDAAGAEVQTPDAVLYARGERSRGLNRNVAVAVIEGVDAVAAATCTAGRGNRDVAAIGRIEVLGKNTDRSGASSVDARCRVDGDVTGA